jgi:hypothetical protein
MDFYNQQIGEIVSGHVRPSTPMVDHWLEMRAEGNKPRKDLNSP